jgi:aminoglycoside phosphotransferase (APT) family kinase protein
VELLEPERLLAFIRQQLPEADEVALSELTRDEQGLSREHFVFDLKWSRGGSEHNWPLILIRDGDRPGQTDRGKEFRLLRALERTTIPAPKPFWCDATGRWLKRPFIVMERVGGAVTPPFRIAYPDEPALRRKMADRFVDILGDLHSLDWRELGLDFLDVPDCESQGYAAHAMKLLEAAIEQPGIVEPHPTIERARSWCRAHTPRTRRLALCHGDYKPDNVLHEDGRILAIIDWERARIGDPMADLAYVCVPHLRAGGLAVGLAEEEEVLRRYAKRTGFVAEEEALAFWQIQLMLQTLFYFHALIADARRRGDAAEPPLRPLISHLLDLIEASLA